MVDLWFVILLAIYGAVALIGSLWSVFRQPPLPEPTEAEPEPHRLPDKRTLAEWFASTDEDGNDKTPD